MENVKKIAWIFEEDNKLSRKRIQLKVSSLCRHRVLTKILHKLIFSSQSRDSKCISVYNLYGFWSVRHWVRRFRYRLFI